MKRFFIVAMAFGMAGAAKADLKDWGPEELLAAHKLALPVLEKEAGSALYKAMTSVSIVKGKKNNSALVTIETTGGRKISVHCHVHGGKEIDCH